MTFIVIRDFTYEGVDYVFGDLIDLTEAPRQVVAGLILAGWVAGGGSGAQSTGFSRVIGDGSATYFEVRHFFSTFELHVQCWSRTQPRYLLTDVVITAPGPDTVGLQFPVAPDFRDVQVVITTHSLALAPEAIIVPDFELAHSALAFTYENIGTGTLSDLGRNGYVLTYENIGAETRAAELSAQRGMYLHSWENIGFETLNDDLRGMYLHAWENITSA